MAPSVALPFWYSFHALSVFPQRLDAFRRAIPLHVLTELHRPPVTVAYGCRLVCALIAPDQLPHWVQPQVVLRRLACWIVAGRYVFEVDVFKVIVEQLANMGRDRLLVESGDLDAVRVDRTVWLFDHLVEHV